MHTSEAGQKVLYVLASYPSPTETFIAREVEALRRRGMTVRVYALRGHGEGARAAGALYRAEWSWAQVGRGVAFCLATRLHATAATFAQLIAHCGRPVNALKLFLNVLRAAPLVALIEEENIDRLHAHFADIPTDLAIALGRLTGRPVTFSAHARDIFVRPVRLAQKCRAVEGVFACSRAAEQELSGIAHGSPIRLMRHGLDFSDQTLRRAYENRLLARRDVAVGTPVRLLSIGRFVRKKGFHVMIEALRLLAGKGIAFECRMIGGGDEWENLQRQIEAAGLAQRITLMPHRPWPQLAAEWERCDLLVQPSIIDEEGDRDGIPNVILEAFALGVPVVASDLPSLLEVVKDGVNGMLTAAGNAVSLADVLERILENPEALEALTRRARAEALEMFDVNRNVSGMLSCWRVGFAPSRRS